MALSDLPAGAIRGLAASINARLGGAFGNNLASNQTAYFGTNARYFQGLRTHTVHPNNGGNDVANNLTSHPSDQIATWINFGLLSATEQFNTEIHNYDGPSGKGYVIIVTFTHSGGTYRRIVNMGPEISKDIDWHQTP